MIKTYFGQFYFPKQQKKKVTKKKIVLPKSRPRSRASSVASSRGRTPRSSSGGLLKKGFFRDAGAALGGGLFGPTGAAIGAGAGSLLAKITGFGDYRLRGNSIMDKTTVPTFGTTAEGMRISHKEFVADVTGSVAFTNTALNINPGNSRLFPFLSTIAQNFEQYKMEGLVFEYRPTSGMYAGTSNTAALGSVQYATNYDVYDAPFASKAEVDAYEFSSSTVPALAMLHPVECKPLTNSSERYYIRNGSPGTLNGDARLYDMGLFQYSTKGQTSPYVVGELWVTYDILLCKPKMSQLFSRTFHARESAAGTAAAADFFGTNPLVLSDAFGDGTIVFVAGSNITFRITRAGNYQIQLVVTAASGITANLALGYGSNITPLVTMADSAVASEAAFTATTAVIVATVVVSSDGNSTNNTVTITGGTGLASGTCDLVVTQLSSGFI